jgi:aquaporin Z
MNPLLVEWAGTTLLLSAISFIGTPLAIGGALFVAVLLGGSISGGHFNPAVTLWALLSGKIGSAKAVSYVLAQVVAAVTVVALKKLTA